MHEKDYVTVELKQEKAVRCERECVLQSDHGRVDREEVQQLRQQQIHARVC